MKSNPTLGVAFITHEAKKHLPFCLPPILSSPLKPRVVLVNSSSGDGSLEIARQMGAETLLIPRDQFNHGTAREQARRYLKTDIIVLMTPDAYPIDNGLLKALIDPLINHQAAISYARQIPHDGADFFESFPRRFNYPPQSHIRSIEDIDKYGVYTFFCSNACAAYLNSALDDIGGFQSTLFGEDTLAAAKLMRRGYKVAYTAEAVVKHSHNYNLKQEFQRHFDMGIVRKENKNLLVAPGSDSKRGRQYCSQMIQTAAKTQPFSLPYVFLHIISKWSGYQLGRIGYKCPHWVKRLFSSQDFYWKNE
jgi:rhamnosyltransferase